MTKASRDLRPLSEIAIVDQATIDQIAEQIPAANWGAIGGTLSAQTDLNSALSGKVNDIEDYSLVPNIEITKLSGLNKITFSPIPPESPQPNEIWIQTI